MVCDKCATTVWEGRLRAGSKLGRSAEQESSLVVRVELEEVAERSRGGCFVGSSFWSSVKLGRRR